MTGKPSFPSDRWRGATIKQEQDSFSQPKPHRDGLIVCSGPVGIAYLIAAITNCYHRDRWDLLLTFSEWIRLTTVLRERHAEMRNKVDDSSEREQIGCSLLESQKWLQRLANAFMVHNLGQICHWLRLTPLLLRGPRLLCVCVCVRHKTTTLLIQYGWLNKKWATGEGQNTDRQLGHVCMWGRKTVMKTSARVEKQRNPMMRLWRSCHSFTCSIDLLKIKMWKSVLSTSDETQKRLLTEDNIKDPPENRIQPLWKVS